MPTETPTETPTPIAIVEPIELGPPFIAEVEEEATVAARIPATSTTGDVLTFAVAIPPAHGVLTLTTALDADGEPILEVATPPVTPGLTPIAAAEGEAAATPVGGETVDMITESEAGAEPLLVAPEDVSQPGVENPTDEATGEATGEAAEEPTGEPTEEPTGEPTEESTPEPSVPEIAPGDFVYAPALDFSGEDTFAVSMADSSGFSTTVAVTMTVLAVNDAPQIDLDSPITLTVGEEVNLPVVVTDVDSDAITLTVDALPPGLELLGGAVTGIVAEEAAGAPYFSLFAAEDADGAVTTVGVEWIVEEAAAETPAGEETPVSEETPPAEEAPVETPAETPAETPQPESPLALPGELTPPALPDAGDAVRELPVFAFSDFTQGSGPLEGYAWLTPAAFGSCPAVVDALAAQPAQLDASTLVDEVRAADVGAAPMLEYDVDLPAPGDYVVSVCGCAPQGVTLPAAEEGGSPIEIANAGASVYVGVNGAPIVTDANGAPLAIGGFSGAPGFTWQNRWSDPNAGITGAATFTAAEAGVHQLNVWMADDGLIVYALRVTPLAAADVEPGEPQACGPSLP